MELREQQAQVISFFLHTINSEKLPYLLRYSCGTFWCGASVLRSRYTKWKILKRKMKWQKKFTWIVLSANKMGRDSMLAMEWRKVKERPKYMRLCLNIHLSDIRPFFAIGLNYDKYDERCQSLNIARTGYCIWCHMCEKVWVSIALSFSMCVCAWIWFRFENTKRNTCIDQIIKCNTTGNGALGFFSVQFCVTLSFCSSHFYSYISRWIKKSLPRDAHTIAVQRMRTKALLLALQQWQRWWRSKLTSE